MPQLTTKAGTRAGMRWVPSCPHVGPHAEINASEVLKGVQALSSVLLEDASAHAMS